MLENNSVNLEKLGSLSLVGDNNFIKNNKILRYEGVWLNCGNDYTKEREKVEIYNFCKENSDIEILFCLKLFNYEDCGYIEFNDKPLDYDDIDGKYLAEVILKLVEIDKIKYKIHIDELKKRYIDYFILMTFINKEIPQDDDEICFFYYMAYTRKQKIALEKIKTRSIFEDYEFVDDDHKRQLFLYAKDTDEISELIIDSKNVLLNIAEYGCIKQLANATEEIKEDKKFIIDLLKCYFKVSNDIKDIIKYLPLKYKDDSDILSLIISNNSDINFYVDSEKEGKFKINPEVNQEIEASTKKLTIFGI